MASVKVSASVQSVQSAHFGQTFKTMYLSFKYTILQMMHVSGHKTQKTFMDYIKLSSDDLKMGEFL
ncbi:MAG: hypothetical protein K2N35_02220 [Muribaculaceae bacterium]|nr:hypothetical protein [Muribaculaceae bacterium]